MKIIVTAVQTPYIRGGATYLREGLVRALIERGHDVETINFPFKFSPEAYIDNLMEFCVQQDFNEFSSYQVDKVIALQFPAYYVQHHHKLLWLIHQHRSVYELYDENTSSIELKRLQEKIHQFDTHELSKVTKRYTIAQRVSERLKKFNDIDSKPLYNPPYGEKNFYCQAPYNYILVPSRLEELKRQHLLIRAMQHVKSPVAVIIAGEGGQRENYQRLIEQLNLASKVKMAGWVSEDEKYALYARALSVFFGPYDEDYGYITLEAMLSAKPVITCTDSGGPLEFVDNGETGFVIPPDTEAIAEKIDWLYCHKRQSADLGMAGKEKYVHMNINWENVIKTLIG